MARSLQYSRANASLPAFTRIPLNRPEPTYEAQPVASSSRHPALPVESWMTAFPEHFRNYRNVSFLQRLHNW
jgi:hypothetical protein